MHHARIYHIITILFVYNGEGQKGNDVETFEESSTSFSIFKNVIGWGVFNFKYNINKFILILFALLVISCKFWSFS
jgi:hypothetical protein